jgi:hypothetical protein
VIGPIQEQLRRISSRFEDQSWQLSLMARACPRLK